MTYGSVVNMLYGNTTPGDEVKVGTGATTLMWSDRHAATVVAVRHFKTGTRKGQVKEVDVQYDVATRVDTNGMSESQEYEYAPNTDGPVATYRVDAKGRYRRLEAAGSTMTQDPDGMWVHVPYGPYRMGTEGLLVGSRKEYHDFSF